MKNKIKGFTIIEIAISTAILTVIIGGMTVFGVQIIRGYKRSQILKNTIENTSYAIENLSKTIRTSNEIEVGAGDKELFIVDNSTGGRYCYHFNNNKLQVKIGDPSDDDCDDISNASSDMVGGDGVEVDGFFRVKQTDRDNNERGFVRINIILNYPTSNRENFDDDEIMVQSSVSLRDYGFDL